jgi:hypothetical protein
LFRRHFAVGVAFEDAPKGVNLFVNVGAGQSFELGHDTILPQTGAAGELKQYFTRHTGHKEAQNAQRKSFLRLLRFFAARKIRVIREICG